MFFVECTLCDVTANGIYAEDEGWLKLDRAVRITGEGVSGRIGGVDWFCPDHAEEAEEANKTPKERLQDATARLRVLNNENDVPKLPDSDPRVQAMHAFKERIRNTPKTPKHPLQDEFGFAHTEEGSEERFHERLQHVPWVKHTFWWLVHNAVAHPIIGVFPRKPAFQFHDWTSRKMHGK